MNEENNFFEPTPLPTESEQQETTLSSSAASETDTLDGISEVAPEATPEATPEAAPETSPPPPPTTPWQGGGYYQVPPYGQPSGTSPYPRQIPPSAPYGQPVPPPYRPVPNQGPIWNQPQPDPPQKPKQNVGLVVFSIILAVALFFTATMFFIYAISGRRSNNTTATNNQSTVSAPSLELNSRPAANPELTEDGFLTDTAIAKKVKPSVVGISSYVRSRTSYQTYSAGSGIILTKDGYIVTNAHVITVESTGKAVDRIQVYLNNEESYTGTIVGVDSRSDLAVIKIHANNLTPAEFGDSTTVEVGEHVLAIGNPSGMQLAGSVTDGIVSGVDRMIRSSSAGYSMSCIQTNAAINPGNSGGALVNAFGQVIGINSAKIVAEGYEGIGFAIAISEAKPIIDSLIANGYVEGRVKIGITYVVIDEFTAALNKVPQGLQVVGIEENLPVTESGLELYDIITKIDGKDVTSTEEINDFLKNKSPGGKVELTVYRLDDNNKGKTLTVSVTLSEDRDEVEENTEQN